MFDEKTIKRFHSKYKVNEKTNCWEWQVQRSVSIGYGRFQFQRKEYLAHRFSMMLIGKNPAGYFVCHSCDNPKCVNPSHLYLGNSKTNSQDMKNRNRTAKGENSEQAKLTWKDVEYIRKYGVISRIGKHEGNIKELCKKFNISNSQIRNILYNKSWKI